MMMMMMMRTTAIFSLVDSHPICSTAFCYKVCVRCYVALPLFQHNLNRGWGNCQYWLFFLYFKLFFFFFCYSQWHCWNWGNPTWAHLALLFVFSDKCAPEMLAGASSSHTQLSIYQFVGAWKVFFKGRLPDLNPSLKPALTSCSKESENFFFLFLRWHSVKTTDSFRGSIGRDVAS